MPGTTLYRHMSWETQAQSLFRDDPLENQFTPVLLPEESHGKRSLASFSPQSCIESDMKWLSTHSCHLINQWSWNLNALPHTSWDFVYSHTCQETNESWKVNLLASGCGDPSYQPGQDELPRWLQASRIRPHWLCLWFLGLECGWLLFQSSHLVFSQDQWERTRISSLDELTKVSLPLPDCVKVTSLFPSQSL